jgi:hypothetical protein
MFHVLMYRKAVAGPTKKPTKAQAKALDHALALARVKREDLVSFVLSGGFHKLPAIPAHVVKNPALRRRDHFAPGDCYILTPADLGRASSSAETVSMAARIWIDRYLVATGIIGRDEFAIVIEQD